ncbi:nucleotidyltransferase family protein [Geminocystis herdmanii]|jgi:predicted nucleotidyltransferase|uniref:nucleotidyltransferase family protein n=1 Tax=Geminocystis herdmanii TaxID=669359 RepID=UPI00034D7E5B|nr:nucleotidyltransferase domain-containing protein [Geminocystis herdmanii]
MINQEIKSILLIFKKQLQEIYRDKLVNVILFGSQAKGTAKEDSDIDVLILLKDQEINIGNEIERTGKIICDLSLKYEKIISRLFMSEDYFNTYDSALIRNIRQEGIIL